MLTSTAIEPLLRFDSWGKPLSTSGSLASTLGKDNPFRYRGYVYDEETGFYYLQSRYYNPEVGRFISSDVLLSTGQGVLGHNAYAYCLNNPVNMSDSCGSYAEAIKPLDGAGGGSLGIGIGIGSLILTIISAITNITTSKPKVKSDSKPREKTKTEYWSASIVDGQIIAISPLTYSEARNWVDSGGSLLCINHAAAIGIVKFYPSARWDRAHKYGCGYLNHYHLSSAHTNHIWYYGE